jgi:hypothetical protein
MYIPILLVCHYLVNSESRNSLDLEASRATRISVRPTIEFRANEMGNQALSKSRYQLLVKNKRMPREINYFTISRFLRSKIPLDTKLALVVTRVHSSLTNQLGSRITKSSWPPYPQCTTVPSSCSHRTAALSSPTLTPQQRPHSHSSPNVTIAVCCLRSATMRLSNCRIMREQRTEEKQEG